MIVGAISEFTDNTTVIHKKRLCLVHLNGTVITLVDDRRRIVGRSPSSGGISASTCWMPVAVPTH
jgi:hypothetical protein